MRKAEIAPWERQPGETEKAYEAFLIFKNLGPGRTFKAVSDRLQKSYTLIRRWKERGNWESRAAEYDRENERKEQIATQKARKKMIERHIKIGTSLQGKALQALEAISPEEMKPQDIERFLQFGTKLESESRAKQATKQAGEGQSAAQMLAAILEKAWKEDSSDGES